MTSNTDHIYIAVALGEGNLRYDMSTAGYVGGGHILAVTTEPVSAEWAARQHGGVVCALPIAVDFRREES